MVDASSYFYNCRGFNFVPHMEKEFRKGGRLPRYSKLYYDGYIPEDGQFAYVRLGEPWHDASNVFLGSNKTAQWYYYDGDEIDTQFSYLRSIGVNAVRVFLEPYMWGYENNTSINSEYYDDSYKRTELREKHLKDIQDLLFRASKYKIKVMFAIFDAIDTLPASIVAYTPMSTSAPIQNLQIESMASGLEFRLHGWTRTPFGLERAKSLNFNEYGVGGLAYNSILEGAWAVYYADPGPPYTLATWPHSVRAVNTYGSDAELDDKFWKNVLHPYLSSVFEVVKDKESMWCFDIANEFGAEIGGTERLLPFDVKSYLESDDTNDWKSWYQEMDAWVTGLPDEGTINGVSHSLFKTIYDAMLKNSFFPITDGADRLVLSATTYLRKRIDDEGLNIAITYSDADPYFDHTLTSPTSFSNSKTIYGESFLTQLAGEARIDFVCFHPYAYSSAWRKRNTELALSGSKTFQLPYMYNEAVYSETFDSYAINVSSFFLDGFGGMPWQAMVDNPFSTMPFVETWGLFFSDGEVRWKPDAAAYVNVAKQWNWLKDSQLKVPDEKGYSTNNGLDGGYTSALQSYDFYDPNDSEVTVTRRQWEGSKFFTDSFYGANAKNFLPPFTWDLGRSFVARDTNIVSKTDFDFFRTTPQDIQNILSGWADAGSVTFDGLTLTGILNDDAQGSSVALEKMEFLGFLVDRCYLFELKDTLIPTWGQLSGSDYQWSSVSENNRLSFSSAYLPFAEEDRKFTNTNVEHPFWATGTIYPNPLIVLSNADGSVTGLDTVVSSIMYPGCLKNRGSQASAAYVNAVFTTSSIGTCLYTEEGLALTSTSVADIEAQHGTMAKFIDYDAYQQKYNTLFTELYKCTVDMKQNGYDIGFNYTNPPPLTFPYFNKGK